MVSSAASAGTSNTEQWFASIDRNRDVDGGGGGGGLTLTLTERY